MRNILVVDGANIVSDEFGSLRNDIIRTDWMVISLRQLVGGMAHSRLAFVEGTALADDLLYAVVAGSGVGCARPGSRRRDNAEPHGIAERTEAAIDLLGRQIAEPIV